MIDSTPLPFIMTNPGYATSLHLFPLLLHSHVFPSIAISPSPAIVTTLTLSHSPPTTHQPTHSLKLTPPPPPRDPMAWQLVKTAQTEPSSLCQLAITAFCSDQPSRTRCSSFSPRSDRRYGVAVFSGSVLCGRHIQFTREGLLWIDSLELCAGVVHSWFLLVCLVAVATAARQALSAESRC